VTHLHTSETLLSIGGWLCVLGGLANIAVGVLHYYGVSQPLVALWQLFTNQQWIYIYPPFPFLPVAFRVAGVVVPILFGVIGGGFAIAALGRRPKLVTQPKGTGIALIIYGVIAGVGCWGVGGVLIVVAGILSILTWTDTRRLPRVVQVRASQPIAPARVIEAPARTGHFCPSCGAGVDAGDRYCFACGAAVE